MIESDWFKKSEVKNLSPFPFCISMQSIVNDIKLMRDFSYTKVLIFFKKRTCVYYLLKNESESVGLAILEKIRMNGNFFKDLVDYQKLFGPKFVKKIKKLSQGYKEKTDEELLGIYSFYLKEYRKIYSHYFPILSVENFLYNDLFKYILNKTRDEKLAAEYLNKLIYEPKAMVRQREKLEMLQLAIKIKNKGWVNFLKRKDDKKDSFFKLIKNHENKWFWLTKDYEEDVMTSQDIIRRLLVLININLKEEESNLRTAILHTLREQKEIAYKIKINKDYKSLIQAMKDGMYLKELRKSIVSQSIFYFEAILGEMAKRGRANLLLVRYLLPSEAKSFLKGNKQLVTKLKRRFVFSMYSVDKEGIHVNVGHNAYKIFNKLNNVSKKMDEVRGIAVSPGKITGVVKIILRPQDFKKILKNNVIVTDNISLKFSDIISKASAVVADGGSGITSHIATLAREANVPCIIGTKISTKIFKDGDKIEVDAIKGIVKKLNN